MEKKRNRQPIEKGRFPCGSLWLFVSSVLSLSEYKTTINETPKSLHGAHIVRS